MQAEEQYLSLVDRIIKEGELKHNRTGVDTLAIAGAIIEHDMSEGFPLLTTRKLPFQSTKVELEFFIKGMTDKRWLEGNKCKFWRYWHSNEHKNFLPIPDKQYAIDDNDLGPLGYSFGWRNFGGDYVKIPSIHTPFNKEISIEKQTNDDFIGKEFQSKYGDFVIEKRTENGTESSRKKNHVSAKYQICFKNTGYRAIYSKKEIKEEKAKDYYFPNILNVACLGNYDKDFPNIKGVLRRWRLMIFRCYDPSHEAYHYYGERGIGVCNKWIVFEYFLEDYKKLLLNSSNLKRPSIERIDLNKDYCLENCKLIELSSQQSNRGNSNWIDLYKDGKLFASEKPICEIEKITNLPRYKIYRIINSKEYKGWRMESHKKEYKFIKKGFDQLAYIINELKTNPDSRRMVCSAWDIKNIDKMALPPCHLFWQVTVINNKLNLSFYMRSCDVICGLPQNLCSYAILLHLLAKESCFKEGKLTAFLCDTHIYKNHEDGAKEQISRHPTPCPRIETNKFTSIFDWQYNDTKLIDYNPEPPIKFEVAV